jgi:hypothetical protein
MGELKGKRDGVMIVLLRSMFRLLVTANFVPSSQILVTLMMVGTLFYGSYKSHMS